MQYYLHKAAELRVQHWVIGNGGYFADVMLTIKSKTAPHTTE